MFARLTNVFLTCLIVAFASVTVHGDQVFSLTEELETDGDSGSRYLSSMFNDGNDFFSRHDYGSANPHPSHTNQTLLSVGGGTHSEFAWAMEDITDTNNPLDPAGSDLAVSVLRLNDIDVSGFSVFRSVRVEIEMAAIYDTSGAQPDTFQINEPVQIQYAYGGDSGGTAGAANPTLLNGTYTTIGQFAGTGVSTEAPSLDADFNGTGDGVFQLTNTLQNFSFIIPDGVGNLSIQIRAVSLDGSDEYVFDNIRVFAAIPEPSTLGFLGLFGTAAFIRRRRKA